MSRFRKLRGKGGFTIIELMVAVAIISIVTLVASIIYYRPVIDRELYDYFGGVLQFNDGSIDYWPTDMIVNKNKGEPVALYLVQRSTGFIRKFELSKPEVISLESFKETIKKK